MIIERLALRDYRNYAQFTLEFNPHKTIILGENAAGKTNVLEAVFLLSYGKSHRTRQDRELLKWGASFSVVELLAHRAAIDAALELEARFIEEPGKSFKALFKKNGQPLRSRSDLVGLLPTVTFFQPDLLVLRGAPDDRRTALDRSLCQYDPVHVKRLSLYQRVRQQKSQWLKHPPQAQDPAVLETLNLQLAEVGAGIMSARLTYIETLLPQARQRYAELSQAREALSVSYQPSVAHFRLDSPETIYASFCEALLHYQSEELRRGQVLVGPHRDDIRYTLDEHDACQFASQGQQRSIILAMKLSELSTLTERLQGETPVLLLDDVMAELDPDRQRQLLDHLDPKMQVILTTTHLDHELTHFAHAGDEATVIRLDRERVQTVDSSAMQLPSLNEVLTGAS